MAILIGCPDVESLRRLMLGQAAADESQSLAEHLLHCAQCAETVHSIDATDLLVQAARAGKNAAQHPDQARIAALIHRLQELPAPSAAAASPTNGGANEETPSESDPVRDWTALLSPPQDPSEIGRLGPYRVLRVLGAGGMGVVFEAEDVQLQRLVALKAMKPDLATSPLHRQRFQREAQAIARLEHDHIVAIYQVGEDRGIPFLAMPLLRGETLENRLVRERQGDKTVPLPVENVLRIGREIAEGLAVAHEHGVTHRDIKPANVWLEKDTCRVKILDFGLARPGEDDAHLTQTGTVAGTPQYMAPEQAAGQPVDHRNDLFSLGCVLYRLTTGCLPFDGPNSLAVLRALALDQPRPPHQLNPTVPPALSDLTMRLLAKEPHDRPQSATEVASVLAEIEKVLGTGAPTPWVGVPLASGGTRSVPTTLTRRRISIIAASLLLLIAAPLAAWYAPAVYRIATNQGQLVIETDDPAVELTVKQNGELIKIVDRKTGKVVTLKAGTYQLELSGGKKGGLKLETDQFTLTRGGREIARVRRDRPIPVADTASRPISPEAPTQAPTAEPDHRSIAQWVQSRGGTLTVQHFDPSSPNQTITPRQTLPERPFNIVGVAFSQIDSLRDEDLARLAGLKACKSVDVSFCTQITDAGLAHLSAMENLAAAYLIETQVSPRGLAAWGARHRLVLVSVGSPTATDEMLEAVAQWPTIRFMYIRGGPLITDRGLKSLTRAPNLEILSLQSTPNVTVGGLKVFREITKLSRLDLISSGFGDSVLDGLIDTLRECPNLTNIRLSQNRFSKEGVQRLAAALPRCMVESDFGTFGPGTAAPPAPLAQPFVILGSDTQSEQKFGTLAEAVVAAKSGDTIEVRGNGPMIREPIFVTGKALTIRAAPGSRPVLEFSAVSLGQGFEKYVRLQTDAPLLLEGLEIRRVGATGENVKRAEWAVVCRKAPLRMANCRFVVSTQPGTTALWADRSALCEVRNCEFVLGQGCGSVVWTCPSMGRLIWDNSLTAGGIGPGINISQRPQDISVQLTRSTYVGPALYFILTVPPQAALGDGKQPAPPFRMEVTENVFHSGYVLGFFQDFPADAPETKAPTAAEAEALLPRLVAWHGQRNLYLEHLNFLALGAAGETLKSVPRKTLDDWRQLWGPTETDSRQGRILFQGGEVATNVYAAPDQFTPDDVRLHRDSAGKGTGEGGRDLGAEVGLVGPGPAYERWKSSPAYQQWLKNTGQLP